MKQAKHLFLSAVLVSILVSSCTSFNCVPGEGEITTKQVDLDLMEAIEIDHAVDVELSYGQNQLVQVTGHENHIALLSTQVSAKKWTIDFDENICSDEFKIHITLPEIKQIDIDGSGNVTGLTPFHTDEFESTIDGSGNLSLHINADEVDINISGSGDVDLSGYADVFEVDIDGSGDVDAFELEAENVEIVGNGSGNIETTAKESLSAEINGSGDVRYDGNPAKVTTDVSGSGTVTKK